MKFTAICALAGLGLIITLAGASFAQDAPDEPDIEVTPAEEEEITQEDLLEAQDSVHGKRGRRLFKTAYWVAGLTGDMKRIYDSYGYPSGRYREHKVGVILEKWTYNEAGRQFIFNGDRLTRTRRFNPGSALGIYLK
jgi:hypothetical protein